MLALVLLTVCTGAIVANQRPNIVLILTDDQDFILDSLQAMPKTRRLLQDSGVAATNYFTSTPVCCPSRSQLLSGRYSHNQIKVSDDPTSCLRQLKTTFPVYLQQNGYRTGMYGKFLNAGGMTRFCPNLSQGKPVEQPKGWDEFYGMCPDTCYYNCTYVYNQREIKHDYNNTGYSPAQIGNRSISFLQDAFTNHPDEPVMLYTAVHAPHLPCIPPPWYANAYTNRSTPRVPNYNLHAPDHHWIVAQQSLLTTEQQAEIDEVYRNRWRTLLSVDDIVSGIVDTLQAHDQLDNTYILFTSDHGFHLGNFALGVAKRQPYDTDLRIPLLIRGPNITSGSTLSTPLFNVDLGPTIMDMAGLPSDAGMDGRSFYRRLLNLASSEVEDSEVVPLVVEYDGGSLGKDAVGQLQRAPNNTYRGLRVYQDVSDTSEQGKPRIDVAYFEFAQQDYNFTVPYMFEFYNLEVDPWQITNKYASLSAELQQALREEMQARSQCDADNCRTALPTSLTQLLQQVL